MVPNYFGRLEEKPKFMSETRHMMRSNDLASDQFYEMDGG